jgi:hypothetical protein
MKPTGWGKTNLVFIRQVASGVYVPAEVLAEIDTYLREVLPDRY